MTDTSKLDPFRTFIAHAGLVYSVDPCLIGAVILHESDGDPNAIGDGGMAKGLMQLHKVACDQVGFNWNDMLDPESNIMCGTAYLRWCYDHVIPDWFWALAAYNQGPTVMKRGYDYASAVTKIEGEI